MEKIQKLVKEKLCKKGEAYRKRRMAAGEKSSAYLSGRAVKVCKGQMSGKKKKKTNENEVLLENKIFDYFKDLGEETLDNIKARLKKIWTTGKEEAKEFKDAFGVVAKLIKKEEVTDQEYKSFKDQMADLGKLMLSAAGGVSLFGAGIGALPAVALATTITKIISFLDLDDELLNFTDSSKETSRGSTKVEQDPKNFKDIGGVKYIKYDAVAPYLNQADAVAENVTEAFDELDDGFDKELEFVIKGGIKLYPSRLKDVVYYIHNNWMAGNYGDDYAIRRISKFLNPINENVAPNHKGKAAPYGSGYKKLDKAIDETLRNESLRDWFKKENWVRINTSGNISGDCGTMKKGKATTRCLPKKKAQSLTKAQRKATVAKKVRGSKKGKQFVKNTKKAEFSK